MRRAYRQSNDQYVALLVTPTASDPVYIYAARQLVILVMCETPVLVSMQAKDIIYVVPHENVTRTLAYVTAKCILNDYPGRPFYIPIARFGKADAHLSKY